MTTPTEPPDTPRRSTWRERFKDQIEAGKAQRQREIEDQDLVTKEREHYLAVIQANRATSTWRPTMGTAADYQTANSPDDPEDDDDETH